MFWQFVKIRVQHLKKKMMRWGDTIHMNWWVLQKLDSVSAQKSRREVVSQGEARPRSGQGLPNMPPESCLMGTAERCCQLCPGEVEPMQHPESYLLKRPWEQKL